MKPSRILDRIDELLALGKAVHGTLRPIEGASFRIADKGKTHGFRAAVLSFIELQFGREHTHYVEFSKSVSANYDSNIESGLAILSVIRNEVSGGWLANVKSLVAAEIFSDFLEMATHLLSAGYKDAAAVMIGSVLEEHLRQLAATASISIGKETDGKFVPKKADLLNSELAKAEVYTKLDQKTITAWLDLRNKAAHGKYDEYETAQVELMSQSVTEFMSRVAP
jgi:hypothetical protein